MYKSSKCIRFTTCSKRTIAFVCDFVCCKFQRNKTRTNLYILSLKKICIQIFKLLYIRYKKSYESSSLPVKFHDEILTLNGSKAWVKSMGQKHGSKFWPKFFCYPHRKGERVEIQSFASLEYISKLLIMWSKGLLILKLCN